MTLGKAKQLAKDLTVEAVQSGAKTVVVAVERDGEWYVCFSGSSLAASGLARQATAVLRRVNDGEVKDYDLVDVKAGLK